MTRLPVAVVGSGPSALAVCLGLEARGIRPLVIDVGLEPGAPSVRVAPAATDALPEKSVRGSDHPYRIPPAKTWSAAPGVGILPSFAKGGHSTVWGASMLPFPREDLRGWPIGPDDLAPHYEAILREVPFSGEADSLATRFPLFGAPSGAVEPGDRIAGILDRARAAQSVPDILIGRARVAINARPISEGGCHACALCMYGCPDHLIFDAGRAIARRAQQGTLDYRGGLIVRQWRRWGNDLLVDVDAVDGRRMPSIPVTRVFIAAGVLGTAEIVVRSLSLWGRPVRILDSQYFVGPLVSYRPETSDQRVTLAQAFVEIRYGTDGDQWAHCQVYSPNHFAHAAIAARFRRVPGGRRLAGRLARRVFPVQGFLPSRDSGSLTLTVAGPRSRGPALVAHPSARSGEVVQRCASVLARERRLLGGIFLRQALEVADVGRSFHIGGSFPMSDSTTNTTHATDPLGRVPGESHVHLADASTLPSISGATITLTSMANARRIAISATGSHHR